MRSPALRFVSCVALVALFLLIASLWSVKNESVSNSHGREIATGAFWGEERRVSNFGLLGYSSVSSTSHNDGPVEEHVVVHAWRLTATVLLTCVSLFGVWAVWTRGPRSRVGHSA